MRDDASTSSGLLAAAKRREPKAWARLDAIYRGLVYYWCRKRLSEDDAADVVQDVFQTVHRFLDEFEKQPGQGGFRAWLLTITSTRIADHHRRQQRRCEPPARGGSSATIGLAALPDRTAAPPDDFYEPDESEHAIFIRGVLDSIRSEYQETSWHAFWRIQVAGEAARDVAGQLGLSIGAALMAAHRITARLRKELAVLGEEGLLPSEETLTQLATPSGTDSSGRDSPSRGESVGNDGTGGRRA